MIGSYNQQKGYYRDKLILETIEKCIALDVNQVKLLLFNEQKYGLRKAQERLKVLFDRKKLKRIRLTLDSCYIYFCRKHGRIEHLVSLNWFYVWKIRNLKNWESIYSWNYEQDYEILQCDAFMGIKKVTGDYKFYFIEMDIAENGNEFDKVRKYCEMYKKELYRNKWWVSKVDRFPGIVVVTTDSKRERVIKKMIEKENKEGLEFKVYLLDDLKKELIGNESCSVVCEG